MRRKLSSLLAVLAVAGLALVTSPGTAHANNPVYVLRNDAGHNCLDVKNGGMNDFDVVDLYSCYGGPVQQWEAIFVWLPGGGAYLLRNEHSQKCLDVRFGSTAAFATVDQYTCYSGDKAELWYLDASRGRDQTVFKNVGSGQDLDDYYGGTADFTPADQFPPVQGDPAELWDVM